MSGNELLFDTNAFIAWSNQDPGVAKRAYEYAKPLLTLISVGELVYGALKSSRPDANREELNRRLRDFEVIIPDKATAELYGEIHLALRRKGRPIPHNDVWIAALAVQHRLPLLRRDAHFNEVESVQVISW